MKTNKGLGNVLKLSKCFYDDPEASKSLRKLQTFPEHSRSFQNLSKFELLAVVVLKNYILQVEAMSTEKSVRVRVKVYDNTTSIYSQDIEISNGEGTFLVPAILADSDVIHLQVI